MVPKGFRASRVRPLLALAQQRHPSRSRSCLAPTLQLLRSGDLTEHEFGCGLRTDSVARFGLQNRQGCQEKGGSSIEANRLGCAEKNSTNFVNYSEFWFVARCHPSWTNALLGECDPIRPLLHVTTLRGTVLPLNRRTPLLLWRTNLAM